MIDLRLAIPAAVAWAVAAVLVGLPYAALPAAISLWVAAGLAAIVAWRVRPISIVALSLVAAAVCSTAIAVQAPLRSPAWVAGIAESGRTVDVVLVAQESVTPEVRSWSARLVALDGRELDSPVIVFGGNPADRAEPGATLAARAQLEPTDPGDDRAFVVFPESDVEQVQAPPVALAWAGDLRAGFRDAASQLPGRGGELLSGLAIGDTTLVSTGLDAAMKTSSLTHLTAVSGANVANRQARGLV